MSILGLVCNPGQPPLISVESGKNRLEAVEEVSSRDDVVDVLAQNDTTRPLLLAMLGPWDFSDLPELAEQ